MMVYKELNEIYQGSWMADQRSGFGRLTLADGTVLEGQFRNGELEGKSKVIKPAK